MGQSGTIGIKKEIITGRVVDLHPCEARHAADIARLRNQEKARYFLAQDFVLTEEKQLHWMEQYASAPDEMGFVAYNKLGELIGTFYLYDFTGHSVELGRVVFDLEKVKGGVPYALECAVIILDVAFNIPGIKEILIHIREDNHSLLKFANTLGFCRVGACVMREQPYIFMRMSSDSRVYQRYNRYIDVWGEKCANREISGIAFNKPDRQNQREGACAL